MKRGLYGLAGYLWKYRRLVLPGILAVVLCDAAQLTIPLVTRSAVDMLDRGVATPARIGRCAAEILALAGVIVLMRFAWRHFLFAAARRAEVDLRRRLFDQVLALPAAYHARHPAGEVMALATSDAETVRVALGMGMMAGFDATVFAAVAVVALLWLNWRLALWTALPFPVLGLVMAVALRVIYHRWDGVQTAFQQLTEKARESLAGMRILRAYVQRKGDARDFERFNQACYRKRMQFVTVDALFTPAVFLLAGLSTAILVGTGGAQVIRGQASLGDFAAFSGYLGMLVWPMVAAGWVVSLVQRGAASMTRILDLLEQPVEASGVTETASEASSSPTAGVLEARHLTFTYPGANTPALEDVSFQVPSGGSLGLVGEVGSGKSTLVALLGRLYEPPPGALFVNGVDVQASDLDILRAAVSAVPQQAFLFSDTIEDNLLLGDPTASRDQMEAACRLAAVDDEVREFPEGYQTVLGEHGITLSGGQRQRVSLARALLKPAPILVLDDTLSAVDADAEHRILEGLRKAFLIRTAVVISHRISAVRDLDWIVVLRRGRVIDQGRHTDLLARPGLYRELYELQQLEA